MTVYQLATFPLGSFLVLLFILVVSACLHGWAFTQIAAYARVLGRSPLWWCITLGVFGSTLGLVFRCAVIFTERIPPLRVVDFVEYTGQLLMILAVILYLKARRLTVELNPHRRRADDQPDLA